MLEQILQFSIARRGFVVLATIALAVVGAFSLMRLPIDAVPDITNNQVQINTTASALSSTDIEKRVTLPIETALAGIPGLEYTRSLSRNGFSQVTAVFSDSVDIYFARNQVTERLAEARENLPGEAEPRMGAICTGLGQHQRRGRVQQIAHPFAERLRQAHRHPVLQALHGQSLRPAPVPIDRQYANHVLPLWCERLEPGREIQRTCHAIGDSWTVGITGACGDDRRERCARRRAFCPARLDNSWPHPAQMRECDGRPHGAAEPPGAPPARSILLGRWPAW